MKKETTRTKIFSKIFVISIIAIVLTTFIILLTEVKAVEQRGCCLDTGTGKTCVTTEKTQCQGRFYTGPPYDCSNIADCKPGTCIPTNKNEPCLRNKPIAECQMLGGVPDTRALEEITQCKPGCCILAQGVKAEVLQLRQCEALAKTLGYDSKQIEFKDNIVSQIECKKQGSPSDLGCCVLGGGDCKYSPRASCTSLNGNFIPLAGDQYCSNIAQCALTAKSYKDCGKLPGTETDIYNFDSQGNQEGLNESCDYPLKLCTKDSITGTAYCKSTICTISGSKGGQEIIANDAPKVKQTDIEGQTLLTGNSVCYNFYTSYNDKDRMKDRSTGLQNQVLHCSFGKIDIEGLGADRQKICLPPDPKTTQVRFAAFHANVRANNWQNCAKCGSSDKLGGFGNDVGDFLGQSSTGFPNGKMWEKIFGDYCDADKCKNSGDCIWHQDLPKILGSVAVGSCDPIYPPGLSQSQCNNCGDGGDAIWNECTEAECYSLGDCKFQKANAWNKVATAAWLWPGLAISERVGLIIPDCVATKMVWCPFLGKTTLACHHPSNTNLLSCLADRGKAYAIYAPAWIMSGKLMDAAWSALSGNVLDTVKSKVGEAISGKTGNTIGG